MYRREAWEAASQGYPAPLPPRDVFGFRTSLFVIIVSIPVLLLWVRIDASSEQVLARESGMGCATSNTAYSKPKQ